MSENETENKVDRYVRELGKTLTDSLRESGDNMTFVLILSDNKNMRGAAASNSDKIGAASMAARFIDELGFEVRSIDDSSVVKDDLSDIPESA